MKVKGKPKLVSFTLIVERPQPDGTVEVEHLVHSPDGELVSTRKEVKDGKDGSSIHPV